MLSLRALSLSVVLAFSFNAVAQKAQAVTPAPGEELAFAHAKHLRYGINTSMWFAQSSDYSVQRLETYTTPADLKLIRAMGFDNIRLSIDPEPLASWVAAVENDPGAATPFMRQIDNAVREANSDGLAVILDIHPSDSYKARLFSGDSGVMAFAMMWRELARHFKTTDPDLVFFELLNEPEQNDPWRWQGIESDVAGEVRAIAPQHTILVAGAHYSGLADLMALRPIDVPNVIYTFHDYEPFAFTHQGATWTDTWVEQERGVPYPMTPENVEPILAQEPTLSGKWFVEQYGLSHWDAQRVDETIAFAHRWSEMYGAPVFCGEFGVFRKYAQPAMRVRWIEDMRTALERYGIGWAMWDYQGAFGVVTKPDGKTSIDVDAVRALGMHMPPGND